MEDDDPEFIRCWCGAEGTYSQLYDHACLERSCGGTGELHCYCGGDMCCCHFHGGIECEGCPDCDPDDEQWDDDGHDDWISEE